MSDPKRIIVALDFPAEAPALALVDRLDPARCRLKVGKEIFTRFGPAFVETLHGRGFEVFLDLKFHDIPNTVAAACAAAADLGVWMVNLHCAGGAAMIDAARASLAQARRAMAGPAPDRGDRADQPGRHRPGRPSAARASRASGSCGSPPWAARPVSTAWSARPRRRRRCVPPWDPDSSW